VLCLSDQGEEIDAEGNTTKEWANQAKALRYIGPLEDLYNARKAKIHVMAAKALLIGELDCGRVDRDRDLVRVLDLYNDCAKGLRLPKQSA
jgi:hypothetical protein